MYNTSLTATARLYRVAITNINNKILYNVGFVLMYNAISIFTKYGDVVIGHVDQFGGWTKPRIVCTAYRFDIIK